MKKTFLILWFLAHLGVSMPPIPEDYQGLCETHHQTTHATTMDGDLDPLLAKGLRLQEETQKWQPYQSNPGISVMRIYRDPHSNQKFVIGGDRFGSGQLKVTISGAIDLGSDRSVRQVYERELKEEFFGQLPLKETKEGKDGPKLEVTGGFQQTAEGGFTHCGWGPCFGWHEVEHGYSEKELRSAIDIMNQNADHHFPVTSFYHQFENLSHEEKKSAAAELLIKWKENPPEETIVPLKTNVYQHLQQVAKEGQTPLPDGYQSGFVFAEKNIHDHTEYKSFHLIPVEDWMRFVQENFLEKREDGQEVYKLAGELEKYSLFTRFGADQHFYQTSRPL